MPSKKFLSDKKSSQQTISISPSLKEWISRYVNVMHKKFPDDKRYKSVSSFYCNVMENVLNIFEMGKTLDDFQRLIDGDIQKIYDENTTLFKPFVEASLIMDSLMPIDSIIESKIFFKFFKFYLKNIDPYDINNLTQFYKRFKNRYLYSNVVKDINVDISIKKGGKGYDVIFEQSSDYKYLQITNVKINVGLLGIFGLKLVDVFYSENTTKYFRLKLTTTDLSFDKNEQREERIALGKENINYIINFANVLENQPSHLWQRLAEDNDLFICFHHNHIHSKWIKKIEGDLKKFGKKETYLLNILKYFEHIHWVRILNENPIEFQINLPKEKNNDQKRFMLDYLSTISNVKQENEKYFLSE